MISGGCKYRLFCSNPMISNSYLLSVVVGLISEPIWKECSTVADWLIPETRYSEKKRILNVLYSKAEKIEPEIRLNACSDESDNRFLECAVAGNADYLVTKNMALW
ncbi:MAG: putative toxin-antitoxin system toxin component, PIN family [Desulfobacteraceae bacterium]|nr:putative toxin-antitoxin system toxin component, PIN family [Desulfobacteraceae bacterium]